MSTGDEELYDGGYSDGLGDAITAIDRAGDLDDARIAVRKLQGYVTCSACGGSGERKEVTERDLIKALLVSAGAQTDLSRPCQTCWGAKVVWPTPTNEGVDTPSIEE